MSSSFYVLCLSHDPATVIGDYGHQPQPALDAITSGIDGHHDCDLLIERVSGGPIEYGCPPHPNRRPEITCRHHGTEWADVDWLRLLAAAHRSTDPAVREAIGRGRFHCWTADRLRRLRHPLGIVDSETP